MRVRIGTSGFSYKEWKGSFYPEKLPAKEMLAFYAARFDAVEINNTFYRMPKPGALAAWARDVAAAPDFAFALKAPVYLTFLSKGKAALEQPVRHFFELASELGRRSGPIYLQLPPTMKKDTAGLRALLELVPYGARVAIEPGNDTWLDDEVYALLRTHGAALCAIDDPKKVVPIVATAEFGYLRLRKTRYTKAALAAWADQILAQRWREAWVFFKHEDEATGPRLAAAFQRALAPRAGAVVHAGA
jgi:uncharacterized protein YecE (DUF72 family)